MRFDYSQSCNLVNRKTFGADHSESCNVRAMFRGDRLAELMREVGVSQTELARRVGVSQATIWKLVKEPSQGSKHTHKIARELNTSAEYLMGETDDRGSVQLSQPGESSTNLEPIESEDEDDELVEIMELDLRFGMGGGSYLELPVKKKPRRFTRGWLRLFTQSPPARVFIARGIGDSMAPTIQNADIVIIDTAENRLDMSDQVFACAYGDAGMIKRLRPMAGGGVKIMSDNPLVEAEMAYDGELHVIGKVVAVVRRMAG